MSHCRSKLVSATQFYFLKHELLSLNGKTRIENGSIIEIFGFIVGPANRDWACQTDCCHTLSYKTSLQ